VLVEFGQQGVVVVGCAQPCLPLGTVGGVEGLTAEVVGQGEPWREQVPGNGLERRALCRRREFSGCRQLFDQGMVQLVGQLL
jgi:hypothetical protein